MKNSTKFAVTKLAALILFCVAGSFFNETASAQWSASVTVATNPTGIIFPVPSTFSAPVIAALPDGSAIAAWNANVSPNQTTQGYRSMYWSIRTNGQWSQPAVLVAGHNNPLAVSIGDPVIAVSATGVVTVAWANGICSQDLASPSVGCYLYNTIQVINRGVDGVWGLPITISGPPGIDGGGLLHASLSAPLIGVSNSGLVTVVWTDSSTSSHPSLVAVSGQGSTWSPAAEIASSFTPPPSGYKFDLSVAGDGSAAVAYVASGNPLYDVYVITREAGFTNFGTTRNISPEGGGFGNNSYPSVAVANGGKVVATWQEYNSNTGRIVLRAASGTTQAQWNSPVTLNVADLDSVADNQIVMTTGGVAVATWVQLPYRAIAAAIMPASSLTFEAPAVLVSTVFAVQGGYLSLSKGADDSAALAWTLSSRIVRASIYNPQTGWSAQTTVSPGGRILPRIAVDSSGTATVVWGVPTGSYELLNGIESATTGASVPVTPPAPTIVVQSSAKGSKKNSTLTLAPTVSCAVACDATVHTLIQLTTKTKKGKKTVIKVTTVKGPDAKVVLAAGKKKKLTIKLKAATVKKIASNLSAKGTATATESVSVAGIADVTATKKTKLSLS